MLKNGLGGLMKQAQQMQENMRKAQSEIALQVIEVEAGSGAVRVLMRGDHSIDSIQLTPEAMLDREMLEDLLLLAFKEAHAKIEQLSQERMKGFTAGMNLPAGLKLPF
ncbi:MAG: YbaB/EbfC family nucleoid-associated protein [Ferrovum sp.]|jgi:hypothetical protein|nr:YbaB/EbfC family nucleoid-associated protein [Ferrovum sp.]